MQTADQEYRTHLLLRRLRSGKHKQTTGALGEIGDDGEWAYCCLGIACLVYQEEGPGDLTYEVKEEMASFDDELSELPTKVRDWYGFRTQSGEMNTPIRKKGCVVNSLIGCNDSLAYSFPQIAGVIESKPPGLFV